MLQKIVLSKLLVFWQLLLKDRHSKPSDSHTTCHIKKKKKLFFIPEALPDAILQFQCLGPALHPVAGVWALGGNMPSQVKSSRLYYHFNHIQ